MQIVHWVMAGLIVYMILTSHFEALEEAQTAARIRLHSGIGVALIGLSVLRVELVRNSPAPPEIAGPRWQLQLAVVVRRAFYVLFFLMPVFGLILAGLVAYDVVIAGVLRISGWLPDDPFQARFMNSVHGFSVDVITGLVMVHVLAALYHQFVKRDGLIGRMLPSIATPAPPSDSGS